MRDAPPLIPRGPIPRAVAIATGAVAGLGLAVELVHARSHAPAVEHAVALLSLSYEQNLPTWYATCLLFACGLALAVIAAEAAEAAEAVDADATDAADAAADLPDARAGARHAARFRRHLWALAVIFCYLSLDESAEIHEHLGGLFGAGGVLYFDWVIPASVVVAALALAYLPFIRALLPLPRRRFVLAGALYVGGALALELPLGWWTERAGPDNLVYALIDWTEETLELLGAGLFLLSLIDHRRALRAARSGSTGVT